MTNAPRLRSSAQNVLSLVLQSASSLFLLVVVTRVLGLEAVGALAVALAGFAVIVVAETAVVAVTTRELQREPHASLTTLFRADARLSGLTLVVVLLGLVATALVAPGVAAVCTPVWLAAVAVVATAPAVAVAQAASRFDVHAFGSTVSSAVVLLLAVPVVSLLGIIGAAVLLAVGALVGRAAVVARARHLVVPQAHGEQSQSRQGLSALLLLGAVGQLGALADVLLLNFLADSAEAGRYRLGAQVPTLLAVVVYKAYDVVYPRLTAGPSDVLPAYLLRWNRTWALASGALLGAAVALREPIARLLVGSDDATAAAVVAVIAVVWLANFAVHGLSLWLIAHKRQSLLVPVVVAEFLVNVAVTAAVVPRYGAVGSALATLGTLAISNLVILPVLLRRKVPDVPVLVLRSSLVPACAAAVVTTLVGTGILGVFR